MRRKLTTFYVTNLNRRLINLFPNHRVSVNAGESLKTKKMHAELHVSGPRRQQLIECIIDTVKGNDWMLSVGEPLFVSEPATDLVGNFKEPISVMRIFTLTDTPVAKPKEYLKLRGQYEEMIQRIITLLIAEALKDNSESTNPFTALHTHPVKIEFVQPGTRKPLVYDPFTLPEGHPARVDMGKGLNEWLTSPITVDSVNQSKTLEIILNQCLDNIDTKRYPNTTMRIKVVNVPGERELGATLYLEGDSAEQLLRDLHQTLNNPISSVARINTPAFAHTPVDEVIKATTDNGVGWYLTLKAGHDSIFSNEEVWHRAVLEMHAVVNHTGNILCGLMQSKPEIKDKQPMYVFNETPTEEDDFQVPFENDCSPLGMAYRQARTAANQLNNLLSNGFKHHHVKLHMHSCMRTGAMDVTLKLWGPRPREAAMELMSVVKGDTTMKPGAPYPLFVLIPSHYIEFPSHILQGQEAVMTVMRVPAQRECNVTNYVKQHQHLHGMLQLIYHTLQPTMPQQAPVTPYEQHPYITMQADQRLYTPQNPYATAQQQQYGYASQQPISPTPRETLCKELLEAEKHVAELKYKLRLLKD